MEIHVSENGIQFANKPFLISFTGLYPLSKHIISLTIKQGAEGNEDNMVRYCVFPASDYFNFDVTDAVRYHLGNLGDSLWGITGVYDSSICLIQITIEAYNQIGEVISSQSRAVEHYLLRANGNQDYDSMYQRDGILLCNETFCVNGKLCLSFYLQGASPATISVMCYQDSSVMQTEPVTLTGAGYTLYHYCADIGIVDAAQVQIETSEGFSIMIPLKIIAVSVREQNELFIANGFGVPEIVVCTGMMRYRKEIESNFIELANGLQQTESSAAKYLEINTGYLSRERFAHIDGLLPCEGGVKLGGRSYILDSMESESETDLSRSITLKIIEK